MSNDTVRQARAERLFGEAEITYMEGRAERVDARADGAITVAAERNHFGYWEFHIPGVDGGLTVDGDKESAVRIVGQLAGLIGNGEKGGVLK